MSAFDYQAAHLRSESYAETIFELGRDSSVRLEATAALYASLCCLWHELRAEGQAPAAFRLLIDDSVTIVIEEGIGGPAVNSRGGAVSAMLADGELDTFREYRGLRVRLKAPPDRVLQRIDTFVFRWLLPFSGFFFLASVLWLRS